MIVGLCFCLSWASGRSMYSYNVFNGCTQRRMHAPLRLRRHCMKGSTVDAMADGVDHAALVLFGVSSAYKESANCRLELT